MTLKEVDDLVTPIIKSGLHKTNKEIRRKMAELGDDLNGYRLQNPFQLNSFGRMSEEVEEKVNELVTCYNKIKATLM